MRGRRALHVLLSLILVVGAAACGGDDDGGGGAETVERGAWIADLCSAIGGWIDDMTELGTGIGEAVGEGSTPEEGRDALVQLFEGAIDATDVMLEAVAEAGAPDMEDGEGLAADLLEKLREAKTILQDGLEEAEDVPVDDPSAFQEAAQELGTSVQESFNALGEGFEELDERYPTADLEEAFEDEPACAVLE